MSDLLSASSLFLAVIGLLYSVWYAEIIAAIGLRAPQHEEDRGPVIRKIKTVCRTRALPLAVASVTLSIILTPDCFSILTFAFHTFSQKGITALFLFNAVKTLYCAITITSIGIAVHTVRLAWRTHTHWKKELVK
jgi:hypothetical protein